MESFLSFVKVTLSFTITMAHDIGHGLYNFVQTHWASIHSYAMYVWFNLNLLAHTIVNFITETVKA